MKLLIVTQVVDTKHPALGFFVGWLQEFARQCESVTVLCLESGEHTLPDNVTVVSLGKDRGLGRWGIFRNFYRAVLAYRQNYSEVLVHMNPIYVVLAGLLWRVLGKRVKLWYTHGTVSVSLRLATILTHQIYTASSESFRLNTKKKLVVGHGIDTTMFAPRDTPKTLDLITIGRISEAKNQLALIELTKALNQVQPVHLRLIGVPLTAADKAYENKLRQLVTDYGLSTMVSFFGAVAHNDLPFVCNQAKVFVTAAQNGSLDKVMLEAMACGVPVVSMADGSRSLPLGRAQVETMEDFVAAVQSVLESKDYQRSDYVSYIREHHSLERLIRTLVTT